jgi:hypothetical protein
LTPRGGRLVEEFTSTKKNLLPFITEWHLNMHNMLSLINASGKMSGSVLPPEKGRPAK